MMFIVNNAVTTYVIGNHAVCMSFDYTDKLVLWHDINKCLNLCK